MGGMNRGECGFFKWGGLRGGGGEVGFGCEKGVGGWVLDGVGEGGGLLIQDGWLLRVVNGGVGNCIFKM